MKRHIQINTGNDGYCRVDIYYDNSVKELEMIARVDGIEAPGIDITLSRLLNGLGITKEECISVIKEAK